MRFKQKGVNRDYILTVNQRMIDNEKEKFETSGAQLLDVTDQNLRTVSQECQEEDESKFGTAKVPEESVSSSKPAEESESQSQIQEQNVKQSQNVNDDFQSNFAQIYRGWNDNHETTTVTGRDVADKLHEEFQSFYQMKFPFEKAQYHQCIPNPEVENGYITVQIINRQLLNGQDFNQEQESEEDEESDEGEEEKQEKTERNKGLTYQRYKLVSTDEADNSESEDSSDETKPVAEYQMYGQSRLREEVDELTGIQSEEFARLEKVVKKGNQKHDIKDSEIAIIGFWGLDQKIYKCVHSFKVPNPVKRQVLDVEGAAIHQVLFGMKKGEIFFFFEKLNGETKQLFLGTLNITSQHLEQAYTNCQPSAEALTTSIEALALKPSASLIVEESKESIEANCTNVYQIKKRKQKETIIPPLECKKNHKLRKVMNRADLNDPDYDHGNAGCDRCSSSIPLEGADVKGLFHCDECKYDICKKCEEEGIRSANMGTIVEQYTKDFNEIAFSDQKQLPNPQLVTRGDQVYVVFTAYLQQNKTSQEMKPVSIAINEDEEEDNTDPTANLTTTCHYPTIFFYNLTNKKVEWQILGAEVLANIDGNKVFYLTNGAWLKWTAENVNSYGASERHSEFKSALNEVQWGDNPSLGSLIDRKNQAPILPASKFYKLSFGQNENLSITSASKVVEAHLHNSNKRLTLVYHGTCAFTFDLKDAVPMTQPAQWEGSFEEKSKFATSIRFKFGEKGASTFEGKGYDQDQNHIKCTGSIEELTNRDQPHMRECRSCKAKDLNRNTANDKGEQYCGHCYDDFKAGENLEECKSCEYQYHTHCIDEYLADYEYAPWFGTQWNGFIIDQDETQNIVIYNVNDIEGANTKIKGSGFDSGAYKYFVIEGKVTGEKEGKKSFTFEKKLKTSLNESGTEIDESTVTFKGEYNTLKHKLEGTWSKGNTKGQFAFEVTKRQQTSIQYGKLKKGSDTFERGNFDTVEAIFNSKNLTFTMMNGEKGIEMKAVEHIDNGQLVYFISAKDVQFIRDENNNGYIQANLTAKPDEADGITDGFVDSKVILYSVSDDKKKDKHKKSGLEKSIEPQHPIEVKFLLNQSFLRTQEQTQAQLWKCMPLSINKSKEVQGSVVYKEQRTGEILLEFYTSKIQEKQIDGRKQPDKVKQKLEYPQQPLAQEWIIEYPVLAYKHFSPGNHEICIANLAQCLHQMVVNLGEWEFVHFVNHTQMVNKKIYQEDNETKCVIMLLVQRLGKIRLMSIQYDPWSGDSSYTIHLFSGVLATNEQSDLRRFYSDKIQLVELLTKRVGNYQWMSLVMQFNDGVVSASINNSSKSKWTQLCNGRDMVTRHLVRGYKEQIYYAQTHESVDKIIKLTLSANPEEGIQATEIYQLAGSRIAAFERDSENIQDDSNDKRTVKQAFYVVDDNQKMYHIVDKDGLKFSVDKVIDFSIHEMRREIHKVRDQDWVHVHITERALTLNGITYSLSTDLQFPLQIPLIYFGGDEDDKQYNWKVQSAENMSNTTMMIAIGQKEYKQFCFVVRPSPGSRKTDIVSFAQEPEIENMIFVSNEQVLVKFKNQHYAVVFNSNGSKCDIDLPYSLSQSIDGMSVLENDIKYLGQLTYYQDLEVYKFCQEAGKLKCEKINYMEYINDTFKEIIKVEKEQELKEKVTLPAKDGKKNQVSNQETADEKKKTEIEKEAKEFAEKIIIGPKLLIRTENDWVESIMIATSIQEQKNNTQGKSGKSEKFKEFQVYEVPKTGLHQNEGIMKVILFNCQSKEEQNQFLQKSQFEIVGPYLVVRDLTSCKIQVNLLPLEKNDKEKKNQLKVDGPADFQQRQINMNTILENANSDQIRFFGVPKSSFKLIKEHVVKSKNLTYYSHLLQVVVRNVSIIYDLDPNATWIDPQTSLEEIDVISSMGQFVDPNCFVNTGFTNYVTYQDEDEVSQFIGHKEIQTNESNTLCFAQTRHDRGGESTQDTAGVIHQTYAELDLHELKQINKTLKDRKKLSDIDLQTVTASFLGNSIFSIYYEDIQVFEQIYGQLSEHEFEDEENTSGQMVENSYLRRVIQILQMPVITLQQRKTEQVKKKGFLDAFQSLFSSKEADNQQNGYKTMCHKSVHYNNTRFRDVLMSITMLSKENTLPMFVDNLDELSILFETMSPTVTSFFEGCFLHTEFCQSVTNVDWKTGDGLEVFGRNSQIINESKANELITRGKPGSGKGTGRQNRVIALRMLRIDWLFRTRKGFSKTVQCLAKAQDESLFSTELVITLVENFWGEYVTGVIRYCLYPFILYFMCTILYFSKYLFVETDGDVLNMEQEYGGEGICRILLIVLMIYFAIFELFQMISKGWSYILDFWNYFDVLSVILNTILLLNRLTTLDLMDKETSVVTAFVAMLVMYWKAFSWFRLFDSTSFYIRLVVETLRGIKFFLLIFIFFQMMFANAIYILDENRDEDQQIFGRLLDTGVGSALLNQYMLSLGEFDTENFSNGNNAAVIWSVFAAATFISQVTILNMLIAIMGDTYDFVTENKDQSSLNEKLNILNDYVWVVGLGKSDSDKKFFFAASPTSLNKNEGKSWDGSISAIKRMVSTGLTDQKSIFIKKFQTVQSELSTATSEVKALKSQAKNNGDQQEASQKLQGKILAMVQEIKESLDSHKNQN